MLYDRTKAGDQGKLFPTPPMFGTRRKGKGSATLEDLPLYRDPRERRAEKEQGVLILD